MLKNLLRRQSHLNFVAINNAKHNSQCCNMDEINPIIKKLYNISDKLRAKFINFTENKLAMHWSWILVVWVCAFMALLSMTQFIKAISYVSIGLLAAHVTNWIHQAILSAKPKKLIEDTSGKAVFITGCDTGFGHQLAVKLDQLGFKVFAGCLFPEGKGSKELRCKTSDRLQIVAIDVTSEATIQNAFKIVKTHLDSSNDRLWALVNNAGIATVTEIEWCPLEVYRHMFDVNTLGLIRVTKMFLPLVRQHEGNRIIIVASLAGRYTFPGFSAYSMSKHAAVSFADGLRREMKKWAISVHIVEPTLYRTPISEEKSFQKNLDIFWEACPDDVKKSYGTEYLNEFKTSVSEHLRKAKPLEKIHEVVDDMVHAVAGEEPRSRYVPSLETQLRAHVLSSLPSDVLDNLFNKSQPRTPPADHLERRNSKLQFEF